MGDALTDSLPRYDIKSQELAYNNTTDRMRIELPERGDPASSGCVSIIGSDGGSNIPVYLSTHLTQSLDSVRSFSSSGTANIPVYLTVGYNAGVDRIKVELPPAGDPSSSGVMLDSVDYATFMIKSLDFKNAQTASGIWTPETGKKFVITDIIVNTASAGVVDIYDSVNTDTNKVVKLTMAANQVFEHSYRKPYISATANNILKYTTSAGASGSLSISGYEK